MDTEGRLSPTDPSSFSRPERVVVTNIKLLLDVNFDKKILSGNVELHVHRKDVNAEELFLDCKDLTIEDVHEVQLEEPLKFTIDKPIAQFGSKLSIQLPKTDSSTYIIRIKYETSNASSGLQWLLPQQTAGKRQPYMFSQFQPIAARSVLPCQDTPAVKTPYSAVITAPKGLTVLMSALSEGTNTLPDGRGEFRFKQPIPIQSYLIAIAVGDLVSKDVSPRVRIWTEKELIDAAHYEFANTEKQLQTAEEICGPYVWQRYDLLMLPPSFPFGGMENPCLTFVTPTLLAGDRSLANVIAHEIAHSWTGNLVTNLNFEHFWLNEGFTVFIERRIIARLEGWEAQDFQALGGLDELKETISEFGQNNALTSLVLNLTMIHPDDSFSKIPYEKGSLFLRYLESVVGGPETFEPFLRKYFDTFKYQSITTNDFKQFFEDEFKHNSKIKFIDWNSWLYGKGIPSLIPDYDKTKTALVGKINNDIFSCFSLTKEGAKQLSSEQIVRLLLHLGQGDPLSKDKILKLQELFNLKTIQNCEIKFRWYRLCIKAKYLDDLDNILKWIGEVGRMKYIKPIYSDLYAYEPTQKKAIENFKKYKNSMMHVSAHIVSKVLKLS